MAGFKEKADAAKALEALLKAEGRHADARIVERLRRSGQTAWSTLKVVHREYVALRQRLGLPTLQDRSNPKE